jgi:putative transposase
LGKIVRAFKSLSAIEINRWSGSTGQLVWQRNYFEHVVRRGEDLDAIRRYICGNPERWEFDQNNPNAIQSTAPSLINAIPDWLP